MFFGLMSVGTVIFFSIFILIRVASTVYNRDIDPYLRNSSRPPLFDFIHTEEEIQEHEAKPFAYFVADYNERRRADIDTQHEQFLRTNLGKSYLRILNGTNK